MLFSRGDLITEVVSVKGTNQNTLFYFLRFSVFNFSCFQLPIKEDEMWCQIKAVENHKFSKQLMSNHARNVKVASFTVVDHAYRIRAIKCYHRPFFQECRKSKSVPCWH